METSDPGSGAAEPDDGDQAPTHYSTGRLTLAQAGLINKWRARLLENRPLPGRPRAGGLARLLGVDDRPPASCSDIIAAAVADLLRQAPGELEIARYAHAGWQAQQAAGRGEGDDDRAPLYPPVSFYLPPELAGQYEALRVRALERVWEVQRELEDEAARRYPDEKKQAAERVGWLAGEMVRLGVPSRPRRVTGGALARMAIDRWARRSADQVAADAVAYSADAHEQPHRGRRDMHQLRR
jgi:hypothetical protein